MPPGEHRCVNQIFHLWQLNAISSFPDFEHNIASMSWCCRLFLPLVTPPNSVSCLCNSKFRKSLLLDFSLIFDFFLSNQRRSDLCTFSLFERTLLIVTHTSFSYMIREAFERILHFTQSNTALYLEFFYTSHSMLQLAFSCVLNSVWWAILMFIRRAIFKICSAITTTVLTMTTTMVMGKWDDEMI